MLAVRQTAQGDIPSGVVGRGKVNEQAKPRLLALEILGTLTTRND